jgi:hypothetical protein
MLNTLALRKEYFTNMGYMSVLFIGENLPKSKLENMILTYAKDFSCKR